MNREQDNKRIAEWMGWHERPFKDGEYCLSGGKAMGVRPDGSTFCPMCEEGYPDYSTSDAAAISLLPVLEETYGWNLRTVNSGDGKLAKCFQLKSYVGIQSEATGDTIAAAITTAILQLIESEVTL